MPRAKSQRVSQAVVTPKSTRKGSSARKNIHVEEEEEDNESGSDIEMPSALTASDYRKPRSGARKRSSNRPPPPSARSRRGRKVSESSDDEDPLVSEEESSSEEDSEEEEAEAEASFEDPDDVEFNGEEGDDAAQKRTFIPKDRDPVYIQNREVPALVLPPSSEDLILPNNLLLQALGVYEILRRFFQCLQLTPFRFEDFCCAVTAEENSRLVADIFSAVIRLLIRDTESSGFCLAPHDEKDSIYLPVACLDEMTWPEMVRMYLQSSAEYRDGLKIIEQSTFPCVSARDKLDLLEIVSSALLRLPGVIRLALTADFVISHEEFCRNCQKPGDLICCELCPATYHLECSVPALKEIPEGEWVCHICRLNQIPGVSDCVTEVEKQNLHMRIEPVGLDRHGRRFTFLSRRLFVYEEDESKVWYYSTIPQFEDVLDLMDPEDLEKELCEALGELRSEIDNHMDVTQKLTKKYSSGKTVYLDQANASLVEQHKRREEEKKRKNEEDKKANNVNEDVVIKEEPGSASTAEPSSKDSSIIKEEGAEPVSGPKIATRTRTGALATKSYSDSLLKNTKDLTTIVVAPHFDGANTFDLQKAAGASYKLGIEGSFRLYKNMFKDNPFAQDKAQRQDERDRKRHLGAKYSLTFEKNNPAEFRWTGLKLGISKAIIATIKNTLLELEKSIHASFFHPAWKSFRKTWLKVVDEADSPEKLALAVIRFESSCRPCIFAPAWHENMGCVKWCKIVAPDREELRNQERRRKREDDEAVVRSAKRCYVSFVQGVHHQIWKHKGEEFRLSGKGGVYWWSSRFGEEKEAEPEELPPPVVEPENSVLIEEDVIDISSALSSNSPLFSVSSSMKEKLDRIWAKDNLVGKNAPVIADETKSVGEVGAGNITSAEEKPVEKMEVDGEVKEKEKVEVKSATENIPTEKKEVSEKLEIITTGKNVEKPLTLMGLKLNGLLKNVDKEKEGKDEEGAKNDVIPKVDNGPKVELPPLLDFKREEDLLDFYRLSQHDYFGLALNGGLIEMGGFKYDFKTSPNWEYAHFPRPNMRTAWRFRTFSVRNWGGVALQVKVIHAAMRWDDMNAKPLQSGRKITHDEHATIYSELVRKRPSSRNLEFRRYEYMIKRVVIPLKDNNHRSNQKSTPTREGLRERRVDTPKSKDPYALESWVVEDELDLWEIKSFYERVEHPPPEAPKLPPANIVVPAPLITSTSYPGVRINNTLRTIVKIPTEGLGGTVHGDMGLKLVPIKAYTTDGKQQYILVPHNADGASFAKHAHAIANFAKKTPGSQLVVNGPLPAPEQGLVVTSIEEPEHVVEPQPEDDSSWIKEHNEKLQKRMIQVKKAIATRVGVLKHGHARMQAEVTTAVLQAMVDENPDLIPGLPEAPIEPIIPLSLLPHPLAVKHVSPERKSPKKSPVKREVHSNAPVTVDGTPQQPEVIPLLKIKKNLLTTPLSIPEALPKKSPEEVKSRAKMINTAPPPVEKPVGPPKKRGRKSNAEKIAEAESERMEAEKAEKEAMASTMTEGSSTPLKESGVEAAKGKKKRKGKVMVNGEVKKKKMEDGEKFVPEIHDFVSPEKMIKGEGTTSVARSVSTSPEKKPSSDGKKRARMQSTSSERSPNTQRRKKIREEEDETVLHCYCHTPYDSNKFYIGCDKCERWFHGDCVHVKEGSISKKAKWFCPDCLASNAAAGASLPAPRPPSPHKHHTQSLPKKKKKKEHRREDHAESKETPVKMEERAPLLKLKIKLPPPPASSSKVPFEPQGTLTLLVDVPSSEKDVIPDHVLEAEEMAEEVAPVDAVGGAEGGVEGVKTTEGAESPSTSSKEERPPKNALIPSISAEDLEKEEADKLEERQPRITLKLKKKNKKSTSTLTEAAKVVKVEDGVISETMKEPTTKPVTSKEMKGGKKIVKRGKKSAPSSVVKKEVGEGSTNGKKPVMVIVPPATISAKVDGAKKSGKETKNKVAEKKMAVETAVKGTGKAKGNKKGAKKEQKKEAERYCVCREPSREGLIQKFIGCEKCKEWFHPRCVGLTDVKAEKMAKFICPNCSSQPQFRDFLFRKLRMPLDGAVLLAVIEEHLERSRVVEMFRNPVSLADVPNYTDVIQEPMDLSTMKDKIQEGAYETVLDFMKDAGLIFDNAKTFNPARSAFHKGADTLEEVFVNRVNKLRANWN